MMNIQNQKSLILAALDHYALALRSADGVHPPEELNLEFDEAADKVDAIYRSIKGEEA